jgi:hypothetical protein
MGTSISQFFGDLSNWPLFVFCKLQCVLILEFGDLILEAPFAVLASRRQFSVQSRETKKLFGCAQDKPEGTPARLRRAGATKACARFVERKQVLMPGTACCAPTESR